MRVGQRLFLAILPAIVGLLTVTALMYFGEYARQAPEWLVLVAVIATLGSSALAWTNARYIAQRIEQLAHDREQGASPAGTTRRATELLGAAIRPRRSQRVDGDELDRIERVLVQQTEALDTERRARADREEVLAAREREYTTLIGAAIERAAVALEEMRLPLHILLENRFGELNENQEEMIGAARAAAESLDDRLRRLREIVQLDAGELPLGKERVRLQDVVAGLLPELRARAADRGIVVDADVSPSMPSIIGDRRRLQDAVAMLLRDVMRETAPKTTVHLTASEAQGALQLQLTGAGTLRASDAVALAERIVRAHGGRVESNDAALTVLLPVTGA